MNFFHGYLFLYEGYDITLVIACLLCVQPPILISLSKTLITAIYIYIYYSGLCLDVCVTNRMCLLCRHWAWFGTRGQFFFVSRIYLFLMPLVCMPSIVLSPVNFCLVAIFVSICQNWIRTQLVVIYARPIYVFVWVLDAATDYDDNGYSAAVVVHQWRLALTVSLRKLNLIKVTLVCLAYVYFVCVLHSVIWHYSMSSELTKLEMAYERA